MKVYVVTEGYYSDYKILAVFSTREKAERYIKLCQKYRDLLNSLEIEEFELDREPEEYVYTFVRMNRDGNVIEVRKTVLDSWLASAWNDPANVNCDVYGNMYLYVRTDDVKKAIKVANEIRTMLIATGRWKCEDLRKERRRK